MKPTNRLNYRLCRLLLFLIVTLACFLITPAYAIDTKNCDALTGGAQRALDYYSVNDLNNGDRAIVVFDSGTSFYFGYFKYDASGTTGEHTTGNHPYYIRPDDYSTKGVWYEILANFVDLDADLSITNLTVTSLLTVNNIAASGTLSGGIIYHPLYANYTIGGTTLFGGYISGLSEPGYAWPSSQGGVTVIAPAATGQGENFVVFNHDDTIVTGNTIFVHFNAADNIECNQAFTAGISKFTISGTTHAQRLIAFSTGVNAWSVVTYGGPNSTEAD